MSDRLDVLDSTGLRTGEALSRREIHRLGKPHRAIRLYLVNPANELLMQRRSAQVDHYPDIFGISVTGHLDSGESSAQAVRRETEEELGVNPSKWPIDFLFSYYSEAVIDETYLDRQFNDIYLCRKDIDLAQIRLDAHEGAEVKFVPWTEFRIMVNDSPLLASVYGRECREVEMFLL